MRIKLDLVASVGFFLLVFASVTSGSFFEPEVLRTMTAEKNAGTIQRLIIGAAIALAVILLLRANRSIRERMSPAAVPLALFCAWAVLSIFWSDVPDVSAYRTFQLSSAVALALIFTAYLRQPELILKVMVAAFLAVVLVNWIGILLMTDSATHKYIHFGAWKGMHSHKNVAGRIMGFAAIAIYAYSRIADRQRFIYRAAALMALIFVYFTESRTAFAASLFGLIMLHLAHYVMLVRKPWLRVGLLFSMAVVFLGVTLVVLLNIIVTLDLTLTGRDALWRFLFEALMTSPLLGLGYGSVWDAGSGVVQMHGYSWFYFALQGHNGYLDTAVALGIPAALLIIGWVLATTIGLLFVPTNAAKVASGYFGLLIYALLVNLTESEFMDRWRSISILLIVLLAVSRMLVALRVNGEVKVGHWAAQSQAT